MDSPNRLQDRARVAKDCRCLLCEWWAQREASPFFGDCRVDPPRGRAPGGGPETHWTWFCCMCTPLASPEEAASRRRLAEAARDEEGA